MMHSMEVAAQTKRERAMVEADQERIARAVRTEQEPEPERPWRGRLRGKVIRRLARVGAFA